MALKTLVGGIAGHHKFCLCPDGASQCPFVGTDWHMLFIHLYMWMAMGTYLAIHMLGASLVVLGGILVVQCGHPRGGCTDKQSAQTPPVRRAADQLSSTRVCQTRVRKSHQRLFLFTS